MWYVLLNRNIGVSTPSSFEFYIYKLEFIFIPKWLIAGVFVCVSVLGLVRAFVYLKFKLSLWIKRHQLWILYILTVWKSYCSNSKFLLSKFAWSYVHWFLLEPSLIGSDRLLKSLLYERGMDCNPTFANCTIIKEKYRCMIKELHFSLVQLWKCRRKCTLHANKNLF